MTTLFFNPAQIITVNTNGSNLKRGSDTSKNDVLLDHSILVENGKIKDLIPNGELSDIAFDTKIDLSEKIVLPGLVECHTHSVFSGSRSDEFNMRLNGQSYEEIAKSGGGINSTVKAVRKSSFEELVNISKPRIDYFISQGVTTLEIKSGYGLSYYDEVKLLQVVKELNKNYEINIIPTFLGAHTFPPEYANDKNKYVDVIINEMLPYIVENNLAVACDAFCESTAFSPTQIESIFKSAIDLGLDIKLHTDQFNSIGGLELAIAMGAKSADHLEVLNDTKVNIFSNSETVAVLLPGVSYSLQYNYAPARNLIDNDAIVALATDYNPGSSHINNISLIWGLAAFNMKMTLDEIISAYTINSASALGCATYTGSIEKGKDADFAVFETNNYSDLLYHFGNNLNCMTVKNGKIIYDK